MNDLDCFRDLARQYAEIAANPKQDERRELWAAHFNLEETRPPVIVRYGMWNAWCREAFAGNALKCREPFLRTYEQRLRMALFQDAIGDDHVSEPWLDVLAVYITGRGHNGEPWGAKVEMHKPEGGGAYKTEGFLRDWKDVEKLTPPPHRIDEAKTAENCERLQDALGDILPVNVKRGPVLSSFAGDISTTVAALRGLEQIMIDMYESPNELHNLLALLRDGILQNQEQAEEAGDYGRADQDNQAVPYARSLNPPAANARGCKRNEMFAFFAAQEYTLISPEFHDEFLFQYQVPIMQKFGLTHYGCCEDLTRKIDMLRPVKNLRAIAVTPSANVTKCAEQIGTDYAISYRPNPTDMVCSNWDEDRVRRIVREDAKSMQGSIFHVNLKDVETLQGDLDRLARWTRVVKETLEE